MDEQQQLRVNRYLQQHISIIGKRLYNLIKQNPLTKTDLRKRTSLPTKQLDDQLHQLAQYNLVRAIKKADKRNQNVWVLFHEKQQQQQEEEKKKNMDLITLIKTKCAPINGKTNGTNMLTISQLKKQAIKKAIDLSMFQEILEMLQMRGQIMITESAENKGEKVIKLREFRRYNIPCLNCELRRLCKPGGSINPSICPYMADW